MEATQLALDLPIWRLSVDGAANAQGSGAGLILTSLDGIDMEYALKFGFQASNNEAKYEAVIAGLNLAHFMEADQLKVSSDSQLVVKQIEDSYKARGEKMILYLKKVRELLKKFIRVQVKHVRRKENSRADALAKLATASQEDLDRLIPVEHLLEPSLSIDNGEVSPLMPNRARWTPSGITWWMVHCQATQRRHPNSERGRQDSSFIGGPFINEDSLRPFLSA